MNHKQEKLERPERLERLAPPETLKKIGIKENDIICDIGAGTGIFTIPAAKLTNNLVYAVDINSELLNIILEKSKQYNLNNIKLINPNGFKYDQIQSNSVNCILLVTVFHEIEEKNLLISEMKRILKSDGKIAVIEFHKRETSIGPEVSHRISIEEVISCFKENNLLITNSFDISDSFYCVIIKQADGSC